MSDPREPVVRLMRFIALNSTPAVGETESGVRCTWGGGAVSVVRVRREAVRARRPEGKG